MKEETAAAAAARADHHEEEEDSSAYICLAAKLNRSFEAYAERPCVAVRPAAGAPFRWYSYRQAGDLARRLGGGLCTLDDSNDAKKQQEEPGGAAEARVLAICRKRDHWWYFYDWGAQLAGLVTIGLDHTATLQGVCSTVRPWCIVVDAETAEPVRHVCAELNLQAKRDHGRGYLPHIIYAVGNSGGLETGVDPSGSRRFLTTEALLAINPTGIKIPVVQRRPDDLATLICTSGSSGVPKAVMLSDSVWSRRVYQPRPGGGPFPADCGGDKLWVSFQPPFHTMDRKSVWECLFVGGKIGIHQDAHGKEELWDDFQELQPDRIISSPAFWKQLHLDWEIAGGTAEATAAILTRLGGRVHTGNISGARPSKALVAFMCDHLGFKKPPGNNYSSTEAHLVMSNGQVDARNGVRVKLIDVPGMYTAAEHRAGELLVASPSILSGYYGNQEATETAIVCDNEGTAWYRTGDVARVVTRDDGSVVLSRDGKTPTYDIIDRVGSVVKMASGEFVNPTVVEEKLSSICTVSVK